MWYKHLIVFTNLNVVSNLQQFSSSLRAEIQEMSVKYLQYIQHSRSRLNTDNLRIKQTLHVFTNCQSRCAVGCTEWHTKKRGNFWKTQQKLKKSKEENLLTEIEPLQLAF